MADAQIGGRECGRQRGGGGHMLNAEMENEIVCVFEGVAAAAKIHINSSHVRGPSITRKPRPPPLPPRYCLSTRRIQPYQHAPYLISLPLTSIPPFCAFEFLFRVRLQSCP